MNVKGCLMFVGLICLLMCSFCSDASADLNDGLVAYYPLNGNARDESGNVYDGTLLGNATADGTLFIGDNNIDGLSIPDSVLNGIADFTVTFWVKINVFHSSGNADPINSVLDVAVSSEQNAFGIYYEKTQDKWGISRNNDNFSFSNSSIDSGAWYHIAVTRSDSLALIFIDGMAVGDSINIGNSPISVVPGGTLIGQEQDCVGGCFKQDQSLAGELDEIRFYNRALSGEEVEELYNEKCTDDDNDGYYVEDDCGTEVDCDDTDDTINPGIDRDLYGDGVDDDCDGEIDEDAPFCNVVSVTPDDFFIGFGLLPRFRLVKIIGGGVDFDNEGDITFSSDNVLVLGSRAISDTEISALIFIMPRADTGRYDASVGDCVGKRVIDLNKWWWN